jgi:hypothetical protein
MALSNSYNYVTTRDDIIKRALRIIGALGTGETPDSAAVTEAAQALNDIIKEWDSDGNFWFWRGAATLTPVVGQNYVQQTGSPPMHKLLDAYITEGTGTAIRRTPLIQYTRSEWNEKVPSWLTTGTPRICLLVPPEPTATTTTSNLYLWPVPDDNFVTTNSGTIAVTFQAGLMDFDTSTDNPGIPKYLYNALVWALAEQLAYEYGVPIADRAQITKKAQTHKAIAMSFDQEDGSITFQPFASWSE